MVALLVLVALVGFGFQTQAFAGTCTKTLCWGLQLYNQLPSSTNGDHNYNAFIKASVDCNLKALKTKAYVVTGSFEFYVSDTTVGSYVVAPLVGTLQKIPVSVNGALATVNSSPVKKPVMSLVESVFSPYNNGFAHDWFLHMIFNDCDLERGIVFGEFDDVGVDEFRAEFWRIPCKNCLSNNFSNKE